MADYLPHTPEEIDEMLGFLGMDSLDQLFAHIPAAVRLSQGLDLPGGQSEPDVAEIFARFTNANGPRRASCCASRAPGPTTTRSRRW